jgi:hypothetical protein
LVVLKFYLPNKFFLDIFFLSLQQNNYLIWPEKTSTCLVLPN